MKTAGFAGVGLAGILAGSLSGCATTDKPKPDVTASLSSVKPGPVVYPKLPYNKVQAPENGCLMGFYRLHAKSMSDSFKKEWMSSTRSADSVQDLAKAFNNPKWDKILSETVIPYIAYYKQTIGKKPATLVFIDTPRLFLNFPTLQVTQAAKEGIILYLNFVSLWPHKPSLRLELVDIVNGKHDSELRALAEGAANFGKQYGGYFVSTLHEMNGPWHYWSQSSKFIDSWKRIVDIFEDKGAMPLPGLRPEGVAPAGQRKIQKSPQPPFVKGGQGGIYREGTTYFLLTNMLVLVAQ